MAIPFLNNINLDDNQLQNAKLHVTSSAPTAATGQIYFDSTTNVTTAKYYDGSAWIDLVDHTFNNGTYINLTEGGTDATRTLTADLSAVDGTAGENERYLTKSNTWATIASIPGTYTWSITGDNGTSSTVTSGNTVDIAGGTNITTAADLNDTVTVNLDDSITLAGTLTVNGTGQSSFAGQVTIPTTPVASTDAASKAYVDASVAGGLVYQGGYNASTNTPDLTTSPNSIEKGWTYTVTADGTFFGEQLRVGDVLIAEVNSPSSLADWTTVQNNIDLASATQVGIGNVNSDTNDTKLGISVGYSSGTASVGLDIDGLTLDQFVDGPGDYAIPVFNEADAINRKADLNDIAIFINGSTSFSGTIGNGSATSIRLENSGAVAPNINHGLGTDSSSFMIQLVDVSSGETVYADVTRGASGQVTIDFATAPATNDIRVLIQKIG
jgi:hypothetical protein